MNISYCVQQERGLIWSEVSNMQYNMGMLFRTQLTYNDLVTNDIAETQPDISKLTKTAVLGCENYEDSASDHFEKDNVYGSMYLYRMRDQEIQEAVVVQYDSKKFGDAKWIRCSGKFMYPELSGFEKHLLVLDIQNNLWKGCKIENKVGDWSNAGEHTNIFYEKRNTWGPVFFFVRIPKNIKEGDLIKMFVWSVGKRDLYMDDLCLELYR